MKEKTVKVSINRGIAAGSLTGAVNGLFGGGGGMIAVPVLGGWLGYPEKQAHATAIAVIAPVCALSAAAYIFGGYFDASVVIPASIGNVVGGLLGARLLSGLSVFWIKVVFAAVMLAAGIRMAVG